ncbi:hypothetical protein GCM10009789_10160 [Kribbella sancticallisti]|uniref:Uncharacterized protein n=1 Tax=Kribbella sancticallisti TaxID=460087 RepID=A0ABP4NAE9_9ACTN
MRRPAAVEMTTSSSSRPTHTTDVCGLPSALIVARTAGFPPSTNFRAPSLKLMPATLKHPTDKLAVEDRKGLAAGVDEDSVTQWCRQVGGDRTVDCYQRD